MMDRGFIALMFTSLVFALVFNATNYLIALVSKFWDIESVVVRNAAHTRSAEQKKTSSEEKHSSDAVCNAAHNCSTESKINSDWEQKKKKHYHKIGEEYLASIDARLKSLEPIEEFNKMPYVN